MFFDYLRIEKTLCNGRDKILFENLKWTKLYANGKQEFLVANGFKPLRIILNEESNMLLISGSFPFFWQGHNFQFANQSFYDTMERLEFLIGISLLNAEIMAFECGEVLQVEQPPNEIIAKHLNLKGFKRTSYEEGLHFEDKVLKIKLYNAGHRLKTVCKPQLQTLIKDYGFNSKAFYIRLENHYKKPSIRFKQRLITLETLFENSFQEIIKNDIIRLYDAIEKSKFLVLPTEKKSLNTSTIPILYLTEMSKRFDFDAQAGLMEFLKLIPSEILNKHDKSKRKKNLIDNLEKLENCKSELISYNLLPKLKAAFY